MGDMVLVTGGAGFIGSFVTSKLLERGCQVRVLDNLVYGREGLNGLLEHPNLELVVGDVCDPDTVTKAVQGVRSVIALAAVVGDAACELDQDRSFAVNYWSNRELISACRKAGAKRLVFASSCSVYGANGNGKLHEESHINPVSLYARTRVLSEELLQASARDLEIVILRLATVCGASARMRFDLMVNTMTAFAQVRKNIRVTGASHWRPHIHVQDAAEAFVQACEAPVRSGSVFNLGSDEQNFTIGEVAEKVAALVPGVRVDYDEDKGDRRSYRVSFERLRREMGFQPRYTVDDAIGEVRTLLASGEIADFTDSRFHNAKFLGLSESREGAA